LPHSQNPEEIRTRAPAKAVSPKLTGVTFEEAWPGRIELPVAGLRVPVIGRRDFVRNKQATGRAKDLADIEDLA
jgi:hypothetical protein